MKFSISLEQRNFLNKKGFIPFYSLLTESELKILNSGLLTEKNIHDLWRENESIKQIVFSRRLVSLVHELTNKKPIRIAFDHYLKEKEKSLLVSDEKTSIFKWFDGIHTLEALSCIKPLVGMFLLALTSVDTEIPLGSGYFILPNAVFSPEELIFSEKQRFFLIAYGDQYSQYLYEDKDPELHFLKSLGYVFGDKLNDRLHPILYR